MFWVDLNPKFLFCNLVHVYKFCIAQRKRATRLPEGIGGQRRATRRDPARPGVFVCSVSPPGSVSNCGCWSEKCLCCWQEAIYLTALWKETSRQKARLSAQRPRLRFSSQIAFFFVSLPCLNIFVFPVLPPTWWGHHSGYRLTKDPGGGPRLEGREIYLSSLKRLFSLSQLIVLVLWPLLCAYLLKYSWI